MGLARVAAIVLAWLAGIALVVGAYVLLGIVFPEGLPGVARMVCAVLLVNVSVGALLLILRASGQDDPGDDSDDGRGGGGGGGGGEPWPGRWPTSDGGGALRIPDFVPEEWTANARSRPTSGAGVD